MTLPDSEQLPQIIAMTGQESKNRSGGAMKSRAAVAFEKGKPLEIDPMITHILKLEDINKGVELMRQGKSIRSVVVF